MSGIYIHVPFCAKKCEYCDFYSTVRKQGIPTFYKTVINELLLRNNYLNDRNIETIYFGGGTPSLINPKDIDEILNEINRLYSVSSNAEITLEANPDDLTRSNLTSFFGLGINRLSIGVQSFNNTDLQFLGRRHDADAAKEAIEVAQNVGFKNISIDLIYALPSSAFEDWEQNLKIAFNQGVQHLSSYTLTYEQGTPLFKKMAKGSVIPVTDEKNLEQFNLLREKAQEHGFVHYEVSNFCKPQFESRHNSAYWKGIPYLGLGPSAHSFNGSSRCWNPKSVNTWQKAIETEILDIETEVLSERERKNELVMLSLRTINGLDLNNFKLQFGNEAYESLFNRACKFIRTGATSINDDKLKINPNLWFVSDSIIVELIE